MKASGIYKFNRSVSNPGPGQYESGSTLSKQQYSMRPKTPYIQGPLFLDG